MFGRSGRRSRDWESGSRSRHRARRVRRGKVSLGGIITGLMVGISSSFLFAVLAGAVLQWQGHDLQAVVRGNTAWASAGAGTAFVLAVFLSFLWGGYTAGRMGAGSGATNGGLVPTVALLILGVSLGLRVGLQGQNSFTFPFGVGTLPLDANFTSLGLAVIAGALVSLVVGGIWGGIIGARWHLRLDDEFGAEYRRKETDSFSDLVERPTP